jgi:ABC-type uncharacterized transport system auxiliary subunit
MKNLKSILILMMVIVMTAGCASQHPRDVYARAHQDKHFVGWKKYSKSYKKANRKPAKMATKGIR